MTDQLSDERVLARLFDDEGNSAMVEVPKGYAQYQDEAGRVFQLSVPTAEVPYRPQTFRELYGYIGQLLEESVQLAKYGIGQCEILEGFMSPRVKEDALTALCQAMIIAEELATGARLCRCITAH